MSSGTETAHKGTILIVDDEPANLELAGTMLKDDGYRVRPVLSGKLALKVAEADPPDTWYCST